MLHYCKYDQTENMVFVDVIKLRILGWVILDLGWALHPMTGVLIKEKKICKIEAGGHMKTEAGIRVKCL